MWYLPGTMTPEQTEEQMVRFGRHREERGFGLWAIEDKASGTFLTSSARFHDAWPEGEHKTEVGCRLDRSY